MFEPGQKIQLTEASRKLFMRSEAESVGTVVRMDVPLVVLTWNSDRKRIKPELVYHSSHFEIVTSAKV